jgi:hypothetical protein
VLVHKVLIDEYKTEEAMAQLKRAIEIDNAGVILTTNPRWLISKEKLANNLKVHSTILLATKNNLVTQEIIKRGGIYIQGEKLKVEKYFNLYSKD